MNSQHESRTAIDGSAFGVEAEPAARIELLNGFRVTAGGESPNLALGSRRLVAYLALQSGPVVRHRVAADLWPDKVEPRALGNMRTALWRLPDLLKPVVVQKGEYLQVAPYVTCDLREAARHAARLLSSEPTAADLNVALLAAELLPGWYDDWAIAAQEQHRQLRLHALDALSHRARRAGMLAEAVQAGLAAVAAEPLRETAYHALILAYIAEGNEAAALRQYESYAHELKDQLGLSPTMTFHALIHGRTDETTRR